MEVVAVVEITLAGVKALYDVLMFLKQVVQDNPQIKVVAKKLIESARAKITGLFAAQRSLAGDPNELLVCQLGYVPFLPHARVKPLRQSGKKLRQRFVDTRFFADQDARVELLSEEAADEEDAEVCVVELPVYDWSLKQHERIEVGHRTDLSGEIAMPHSPRKQ